MYWLVSKVPLVSKLLICKCVGWTLNMNNMHGMLIRFGLLAVAGFLLEVTNLQLFRTDAYIENEYHLLAIVRGSKVGPPNVTDITMTNCTYALSIKDLKPIFQQIWQKICLQIIVVITSIKILIEQNPYQIDRLI